MRIYTHHNLVSYNQWQPAADLSSLQIDWTASNNKSYHTLIITDIDAAQSPYLHALVVNIPGNNIANGDVLMSYTPPNPPINSNDHRYIISIYTQKYRISQSVISNRSNFDIINFITKNNLTLSETETIVVNPNAKQFYLLESVTSIAPHPDHPLIIGDSLLSEAEKKYCSCIVEIAERQPGACNLEKAWFEQRDDRTCANPFAVCAKSTGGSNRKCIQNYNYSSMSDSQLIAFANLNNISVPSPFNRLTVINNIKSDK
jgi:hypothetical protein